MLDVTDPENASKVRALAAKADIVFEDFAPGDAAVWGWGWEALGAERDDLVLVSITPFGQTGPYRGYRGSEITLQAMGGPMLATGHPSLGPLKQPATSPTTTPGSSPASPPCSCGCGSKPAGRATGSTLP